jgi:hypothetical protein
LCLRGGGEGGRGISVHRSSWAFVGNGTLLQGSYSQSWIGCSQECNILFVLIGVFGTR